MRVKTLINWLNDNLNEAQVHGRNFLTKFKSFTRLSVKQKEHLMAAFKEYRNWHNFNGGLKGYSNDIIKERVRSLNHYKIAADRAEFSAQSKFHSSILEEFLYFLFRDLVEELNNSSRDKKIMLGGTTAYSNLYFAPENIKEFIKSPNMKINEKDQDFAIYRSIKIAADNEHKIINVPILSVECKTYIDKTMLEGSIATAEKIKNGNPYCLFAVVTEWYDVSFEVDPKYSRIDQIYVLRKQKRRTSKYNEMAADVATDLFLFVRSHVERGWSNIEQKLSKEGKIL